MHPKDLPTATGAFQAMQAWTGPLDRWVILPMMSAIGRRRREKGARTQEPGRRRTHLLARARTDRGRPTVSRACILLAGRDGDRRTVLMWMWQPLGEVERASEADRVPGSNCGL